MERLTDEQRETVAELAWVGRMHASRYIRRNRLFGAVCDSVESAAGLAVVWAVQKYDAARSAYDLEGFVVAAVPRLILDALRLEFGRVGKLGYESRAALVPLKHGAGPVAPWDDFERVDARDAARWALGAMTARERLAAERYIMADRSAPDVATECGVSQTRVRQWWQSAANRIKNRTNEGEL